MRQPIHESHIAEAIAAIPVAPVYGRADHKMKGQAPRSVILGGMAWEIILPQWPARSYYWNEANRVGIWNVTHRGTYYVRFPDASISLRSSSTRGGVKHFRLRETAAKGAAEYLKWNDSTPLPKPVAQVQETPRATVEQIGDDYVVTWTIDVVASSPRDAAIQARRHQTRRDTTAVVFDVTDATGETTRVDLSYGRIDE